MNIQISGLTVGLQSPRPIAVTKACEPFLAEGPADVQVELTEQAQLSLPREAPVWESDTLQVYREGQGFLRAFRDPLKGGGTYALTRFLEDDRILVQYRPQFAYSFADTRNSLFHIGMEELLLRQDRLMLHASLVDTPFGGLLFCGPCGCGKSTQAELWREFGGGRILNGDRAVLCDRAGTWWAYGSPYAGSSCVYVQAGVPIRAIILPEKAPENLAVTLGAMEAFPRLYAQTTVNPWNPRFVSRAADLLIGLLAAVPVYTLRCTRDVGAVQTLRKELQAK